MAYDSYEVLFFALSTDQWRLPGKPATFAVGVDGPSARLTQGCVLVEWYDGTRAAYPVQHLGRIDLPARQQLAPEAA